MPAPPGTAARAWLKCAVWASAAWVKRQVRTSKQIAAETILQLRIDTTKDATLAPPHYMVCRRSAPDRLVLTQTVTSSAMRIILLQPENELRAKKNPKGKGIVHLQSLPFPFLPRSTAGR
jgi:hypothetical protein